MHKPSRRLLLALVLMTTPIALPAPTSPRRQSVSIKDMRFNPARLEIKLGDTVTWINNDDRDHEVVARDGSFHSDNLRPRSSFSCRFAKTGTFSYSCVYHPREKGVVTVSGD